MAINNSNIAGSSNEFIEFMLKMIYETVSNLLNMTTQETTQKTTQEKIIDLIKKTPSITQSQIAKTLGITRDGVSYNMKKLKEKKLIERIGSIKNGNWKIIE